jgi:hypothetical protein
VKTHFPATLFLVSLLLSPALQAQEISFQFINNSDQLVTGFYLFPASKEIEAENMLEGAAMAPGEAANANLGEAVDGCVYTVLVDFQDGSTNQLDELDLCNSKIIRAVSETTSAPRMQTAQSDEGCETRPLGNSCDWEKELAVVGELFIQSSGKLPPQEAERLISLMSEAFNKGEKRDATGACSIIEQLNKELSCL